MGSGAAQWVAYAILFILGLIYLAFTLMLIVKLIEGLIRIFGGVGFHESRHVVDSGLLGVLGLVGCCGSKRPRRRSRYRQEPQPATLPLKRPSPPFKDVTPTASGPPSVLRPEHALQPYKEESDDETGFIMGAWQPFPRPGYNTVDDHPTPEPPKSGFARVGGGRAHYDSPYAIQSSSVRGSSQTFPSDRNATTAHLTTTQSQDYSPPGTPSISSAVLAKQADVSLPPGAMPPAHIRTKSQTAIVEDASALINLSDLRPLYGDIGHVEDEEAAAAAEAVQPRKKWFNLRKNRRQSEADPLSEALASEPDPGRSFVVVRKTRPGQPTATGGSSEPEPQQRSFTVLRGNNAES